MTASYVAGDQFDRGKTFYAGGTIDTNDYGGVFLEGQVRIFPNRDPSNKQTRRGGQSVVCVCVRNVSTGTFALLPKRLTQWETGYRGLRVNSYAGDSTASADEIAGVVDEFLPTAGVVFGDLFWLVVEGPTLVKTSITANDALTSEGSLLVATSAATSQATTCGRVMPTLLTGATATLAAFIYNRLGRAMSANSSNGTDRDLLVDVKLV